MRSTWARLIHKVYEVDPLECPRCKGPMRVIALIDDAAVIRKILSHLGLWARPDLPPCSRHRLNPLRRGCIALRGHSMKRRAGSLANSRMFPVTTVAPILNACAAPEIAS